MVLISHMQLRQVRNRPKWCIMAAVALAYMPSTLISGSAAAAPAGSLCEHSQVPVGQFSCLTAGHHPGDFIRARYNVKDMTQKTYYFLMNGGDGDQRYFASQMRLKSVAENWFSGRLGDEGAMLLMAENGEFKGTYFVITSRLVEDIQSQIRHREWVSVIIHRVKDPGTVKSHFDRNDVDTLGMTALKIMK
jgi:hypothetical protein